MEENTLQETAENAVNTETDYIDAIKQLKQNSVNKDDYNKLKSENKKLIDALVNGDSIEIQKPAQRSEDEIKRAILSGKGTDLEIATNIMDLYNLKKEAGENIFISNSEGLSPSELQDAQYNAEAVAQCLQDTIDYCNGDSSQFHNYFNNRLVETSKIRR